MIKLGVVQTGTAVEVEWESFDLRDSVEWKVLELQDEAGEWNGSIAEFSEAIRDLDGVIWSKDAQWPEALWRQFLLEVNQAEFRDRQFWIWLQSADQDLAEEFLEGVFDDLLLAPVRKLDIQTKIAQAARYRSVHELSRINQDFSETLSGLREDLDLATRLQKGRLPRRFDDVRGIKIHHRYLAGVKPGGDYFDLADNRDESQLSLVLTDSSSHGLSNSVLSVLMRVAVKLSQSEVASARETVSRIADEILMTLNLKDHLSLFYGVISRKDFKMRYVNLGSSRILYYPAQGPGRILETHGLPVTRSQGLPQGSEGSIELSASDRLVIVSDGYIDGVGGPEQLLELGEKFKNAPAIDLQNELAFKIKSKLKDENDMPDQDCTLSILDLDAKLIRRVS
jgi:serine phosphatase RsbU (regulator of sigma subunit)